MRVNIVGPDLQIDPDGMDSGDRKCGSCTLCCRLMAVPVLKKKAGERCKHQRHGKGCGIYKTRPDECRDWSCRWLAEATETHMLQRPDHCHYLIDLWPDLMTLQNKETGETHEIAVVQVWVDPAHPEAKDDPRLREYMAFMAAPPRLMASILRFGNERAIVVAAPSMSLNGEWYEDHAPVLSPHHGMHTLAGWKKRA